ncbi:MAG: heme A synthase [Robiginitomaculum sp.]|nr:MAG: heme A synthase [Robiginitomaculum sp.]
MSSLYSRKSRSVGFWLGFMTLLVAIMILVGGATRLTNAGLSITEWRPVSGAMPPMSDAEWLSEFEKYKLIPEFNAENPDMELSGFKFIYFMEWSHRQLGRFIGLVYLFPFLLFMFLGKLERGKKGRFFSVLLLIGLQGAIGWWMVSSGLGEGRVDVSQYRLATHLGMAFLILAILFWTWLDHLQSWPASNSAPRLKGRTTLLFLLVFLQIIAGAFVAGTHAGMSYNTWPLMDGGFIPNGYLAMNPLWKNMFENVASIQFNHRMLGYFTLIMTLWVWGAANRHREANIVRASSWLLASVLCQMALGIVALLKVIELPYAISHQAGAIIVFIFAIWTMRSARVRTY